DPDLPAALGGAGHRDAGRLDLAGRDPPGLENLQADVPEGERRAAIRLPAHATALLLPVLDLRRHHHGSDLSRFPAVLRLVLLAAVNPRLHADLSVRLVGLGEAVVDVGLEGVER